MRAAVALAVVLACVSDATARGRAGVTTRTFVGAARGRTLVTEVWYPARGEGRETTPRRGRFPLVLVAHGLCGSRLLYTYLSAHLARHGFIVAAPDFPGVDLAACAVGSPQDLTEPGNGLVFLASAFGDASGAAGALASAVRGFRLGLVGHSFGGLAVVNAAAAEPRFRALVTLAPAAGPAQGMLLAHLRPRCAVLAASGTADAVVPYRVTRLFFAALAPPAFLLGIEGGTHGGFAGPDPSRPTRQQRLVRRYATAFLARYLARRPAAGAILTAADAAAQGGGVVLRARLR